jgi:hypothetical protein
MEINRAIVRTFGIETALEIFHKKRNVEEVRIKKNNLINTG